jgi:BirA family biotin operon repressor/biotin-[acetyl-CoA-carboxylase] ligase
MGQGPSPGRSAGPRILAVVETDSTNDEARRRAVAGEAPPFWVRAERQTRGRGRQGRSWVGLPGNLFLSGFYRLSCPPSEAAQLGFAAALAIADALDASVDPRRVRFKWPNDVKLDGGKIAGVLLEASAAPRGVDLVVGIGVNLAGAPALAADAAAPASALGGDAPSAEEMGERVAAAFETWRERWAERGFAPLRTAWLARAEGLGGPVRASLGSTSVEGVFEDLDADGGLVMTTPAGRRTIRSGEVFFGPVSAQGSASSHEASSGAA